MDKDYTMKPRQSFNCLCFKKNHKDRTVHKKTQNRKLKLKAAGYLICSCKKTKASQSPILICRNFPYTVLLTYFVAHLPFKKYSDRSFLQSMSHLNI